MSEPSTKGHVVHVNSATLLMGVTGCIAGDSELRLNRATLGRRQTIARECYNRRHTSGFPRRPDLPTYIRALKGERVGLHQIEDVVYSGVKKTYRLYLEGHGPTLRATPDHGIWTPEGFVPLGDLRAGMEVCGEDVRRSKGQKEKLQYTRVAGLLYHPYASQMQPADRSRASYSVPVHRLVVEADLNGLTYEQFLSICRTHANVAGGLTFIDPEEFAVHHVDEDTKNNTRDNLEILTHEAHRRLHGRDAADHFGDGHVRTWRVIQVAEYGQEDTFDVQCAEPYHNFTANGLIVHNSGKSALLGTLAEYVWETYHKILRLTTTDGGGFPSNVQALMQLGIMQVFRARTRDLADGSLSFETCLRASQGWWPKIINPATGEVPPGVQMIPPITEQYSMACPQGHLVKAVPFQSLLTATMCPTCRVMVDRSNMQVTKTAAVTKGFEPVGAVAFDGLTSMLSWMMSDMGQRAGRLELKGEEGAIGGKITSGEMKLGGSSRSHYGFAQSRSEELVLNSLGIPNLVVPPVFTALTMETMDEGELSVRGPLLIGKAKTAEAGAWFGDCLEAMVLKTDKDERIYRLCLSEFVDSGGVRHLVKNRASPGTMPSFLEDPPLVAGHEAATAFSNFNLGVFFSLRDKARVATEITMNAKYPDAPGLPEGLVQVGEGSAEAAGGKLPPAAGGPAPKPGPVTVGPPAVGKPRTAPPVGTATPRPGGPPVRPVAAAPKPTPPLATGSQPPVPAEQPAAPATPVVPTSVAPAGNGQTRSAWAAPAAPRPPAVAPRVGAPLTKP